MPKTNRLDFKKIIAESAIIIFSVLFALFINEWRNNVTEEKRTQIILNNLEAEIETNKKLATKLLKYHKGVTSEINSVIAKDSLEAYFLNGDIFHIFNVAPNGLIQDDFKTIAWEVAKQEKLSSRIDFKTSAKLYEAYVRQASVNESIDRIFNFITTRTIQDKKLIKQSVVMLGIEFEDLWQQERSLIKRYDRALDAIKK